MNPGRELDALIAEKVMGWRWVRHETIERNCLVSPKSRWKKPPVSFFIRSEDWDLHLPHYSTDIAAAWEVVERLKNLTQGDFRLTSLFMNAHRYCAHFVDPNDKHTALRFGDTAPHAICLAAFKAVEK